MDELINYVTESPENTNPNVVRSLLSQIPTSGNSGEIFVIKGTLEYFEEEDEEYIVSNKTFREISDAVSRKDFIVVIATEQDNPDYYKVGVFNGYLNHDEVDDLYEIGFASLLGNSEYLTFEAESQDDYPLGYVEAVPD